MSCSRCSNIAAETSGRLVRSCAACGSSLVVCTMSGCEASGVDTSTWIELDEPFLERWELQEQIGAGATARVFRALDRTNGELVAIKFLARTELLGLHQRFALESRILLKLRHPRLLTVFDAGEVGGRPYLVSQLCEGGSLRDLIESGPLSLEKKLDAVRDVLSALQACHDAGIVHRDVKPENVLLASDGTLRLADLGLARELADESGLTPSGALNGTPLYMAPEVIQGETLTPSADIYATGVMLFELITGRRPFVGATPFHVLSMHVEEPPPAVRSLVPDVPIALERLVARALAKAPHERPESAAAFSEALARCVEVVNGRASDDPATASPPASSPRLTGKRVVPRATRLQKSLERVHPRWWLAAALALAGLVGVAAVHRSKATPDDEDRRRTLEILAPASRLIASPVR